MTVERTERVAMPGRKWYWVAGLVGVVGVAAFAILLIGSILGIGDELEQMLAPGKAEFVFSEPGTYTVFHEHETVFEGRYYSSPAIVSGLTVKVSPKAGGAAVEVRPAGDNSNYAINGREGISIFEFEIVELGLYRVTAAYADNRRSPEVVLAISHDFMGKLLITIIGCFAIIIVSLGGAIAIAIVTYRKREDAIAASKRG